VCDVELSRPHVDVCVSQLRVSCGRAAETRLRQTGQDWIQSGQHDGRRTDYSLVSS